MWNGVRVTIQPQDVAESTMCCYAVCATSESRSVRQTLHSPGCLDEDFILTSSLRQVSSHDVGMKTPWFFSNPKAANLSPHCFSCRARACASEYTDPQWQPAFVVTPARSSLSRQPHTYWHLHAKYCEPMYFLAESVHTKDTDFSVSLQPIQLPAIP